MQPTSKRKIILTGGGSAGHVIPNIALISKFKQEDWDIFYIGSKQGIERELIAKINVPYIAIATGKLRRYFSWQNFIDPFKVVYGLLQAIYYCHKIKPKIIFSKGGFVAFPVVVGAWLNRIPVVVHESDLIPGLANKLSFPFSKQICVTFALTKKGFKNREKITVTGTPIRPELYLGNAEHGRKICAFTSNKKIILVYGGGSGAEIINRNIRSLLPEMLADFQVIHGCGKNKVDSKLDIAGYKQFEFMGTELPDLLACANLVISRAGANSLCELLALNKPHILIPLSKAASRGDQIINAQYHAKLGLSQVILEDKLTPQTLIAKIQWVAEHENELITELAKHKKINSIEMIYGILEKNAGFPPARQ
jgi:UDP-N-acetylglucosamine--N-acetylmuramyl-(pentapeptide) pyrophosphoryl-undecaprenol N-acetylglucosamine transferase